MEDKDRQHLATLVDTAIIKVYLLQPAPSLKLALLNAHAFPQSSMLLLSTICQDRSCENGHLEGALLAVASVIHVHGCVLCLSGLKPPL